MADSISLQDWVTLSSNASGSTITQNESSWLDVSGYQDACFYFQLAGYSGTGTTNIFLQTSPTKDEVFFAASATGSQAGLAKFVIATGANAAVQNLQISRWATEANQPLAKYLRWQLQFPTAATTISFRIWVTLNQAGYAG